MRLVKYMDKDKVERVAVDVESLVDVMERIEAEKSLYDVESLTHLNRLLREDWVRLRMGLLRVLEDFEEEDPEDPEAEVVEDLGAVEAAKKELEGGR